MKKTITAVLFAAALSGAAAAQSIGARIFVSGVGTDTGTCIRSKPCRTFAFAIGVVPASGEIVALDPAEYGPVTINKAITITGSGRGLAQITAGGGDGITISAGAGDGVVLRGIEIDGGNYGININSFGSLVVTDTVIRGGQFGIVSFAAGNVTIADSTIVNSQSAGVFLDKAALVMTGSTIGNGGDIGLSLSGPSRLIDCTIINTGTGFSTSAPAFLKDSVLSGNRVGVGLAANTTVTLDTTTITANGTGIEAINSGNHVNSYGNNNIAGNGIDGSGSPITRVTPD